MTPAKWRALGEYLESSVTVTGPGLRVRKVGNTTILSARRRGMGGGGGGGTIGTCPFSEIITVTPEEGDPYKAIRGGYIFCGDQNWVMPSLQINPAVHGVWLVWIEVPVVCNIDDDGEVILPGISTGTRPDDIWSKIEYTEGTNYPPNENPTLPTGEGKIMLPIGLLTIVEGSQTLGVGVGCGNFFIDQCAGTLAFRKTMSP